jgi:AGZA family xanthine/uracil permease-like MFS transporter
VRIERYFKLKENKTSLKIETIAGTTTFMTMAYIIFVNPSILSETGMNFEAVVLATILASAIGCLLRVLFAPNLPFAVAPGMGINAFFAYTICAGMGLSWQVALGVVFLDGLIFAAICLLPIRDRLIRDIPHTIKLSTGVGIGLFIAFTGLMKTGVIVKSEATLVQLGNVLNPEVLMTLIGILIIVFWQAKESKVLYYGE